VSQVQKQLQKLVAVGVIERKKASKGRGHACQRVFRDIRPWRRVFGVPALLLCIVVMKEAALDFARRHELPPPSWWANTVGASDETKNNMPPDGTAPISGAVSQKILARPSGRRPKERERVQEAMRDDIRQGRRTAAQLQGMLEKTMSSEYHTSRYTARQARQVVLSELSETQFPTITTNDK
jgi:hypothetical protein